MPCDSCARVLRQVIDILGALQSCEKCYPNTRIKLQASRCEKSALFQLRELARTIVGDFSETEAEQCCGWPSSGTEELLEPFKSNQHKERDSKTDTFKKECDSKLYSSILIKESDSESDIFVKESDSETDTFKKERDSKIYSSILIKESDSESDIFMKESDSETDIFVIYSSILIKESDSESDIFMKESDSETDIFVKDIKAERVDSNEEMDIENGAKIPENTKQDEENNVTEINVKTVGVDGNMERDIENAAKIPENAKQDEENDETESNDKTERVDGNMERNIENAAKIPENTNQGEDISVTGQVDISDVAMKPVKHAKLVPSLKVKIRRLKFNSTVDSNASSDENDENGITERSMALKYRKKLKQRSSRIKDIKNDEELEEIEAIIYTQGWRAVKNVENLPNRGRGVVATKDIIKGEIVCDYKGIYMEDDEEIDDPMTYVFSFSYKGIWIQVDARKEDRSFGRLLNHSPNHSNVKARILELHNKPHIVFVATRNISKGEEILLNYNMSKDSKPYLKNCPCVRCCGEETMIPI